MTAAGHAAFVFAADMLHNTLMLMMALRILRVRIRPFRIVFAAFFGAAAAFACFLAGESRLSALAAAPLGAAMMRMAAGRSGSIRAMFRRCCVLLACAGYIGGMVLALAGATGSLAAAHVAGGALCAAVFVIVLRTGRASGDVRCVRVIFTAAGTTLSVEAIVDSGNSLRDYLTHRPVIVAGEALMKKLPAGRACFRPIFADTAGGRQMMRLIMPEETALCYRGKRVPVDAALAFSPGLGKDAAALVPLSLLTAAEQAD